MLCTPSRGMQRVGQKRAGAHVFAHPSPVPGACLPLPAGSVAAMRGWTTGQEELLREFAHLGAEAVSRELRERLGVVRSAHAIEMHASRIHVSLRRLSECPECGLLVERLNRQTGLCPRCSERQHVERARAYNELLERETAAAELEREDAAREYATLRQKNARLRRQMAKKGLEPPTL